MFYTRPSSSERFSFPFFCVAWMGVAGNFSVCRSIRSRVCCWRSFGILLFSRGHETQTTLGRELFSLLPSSSFFRVAHFTGVCVHLNGRAQQQFTLNYRSDGWKEGKRDTKKGSRVRTIQVRKHWMYTLCCCDGSPTALETLPPNKPANKVQHFLFFSSVCSRIVRLFSCCAARIKCHDEFLN